MRLAVGLIAIIILALSITPQATAEISFIRLAPQGRVEEGDVLLPHLWDLVFDGVDDYVEVSHSQSIDLTTMLSISIWYYKQENTSAWLLNKNRQYLNDTQYGLESYYDRLNFVLGGSTRVSWTSESLIGRPVHIVASWNGVSATLYVNGTQVASSSYYGVLTSQPYSLTIGTRKPPSMFFNGVISAVIIHATPQAPTWVAEQYYNKTIQSYGLALFIDPSFHDYYLIDASGNNTIILRNGLRIVPASEKWLWIIKKQYNDAYVRLKYFPLGSIVVFSDGKTQTINGPVNSAGLVEIYTVDRTDIVEILVPLITISTTAPRTIYAGEKTVLNITARHVYMSEISNITVRIGNLTVSWTRNGGFQDPYAILDLSESRAVSSPGGVELNLVLAIQQDPGGREILVEAFGSDGSYSSFTTRFIFVDLSWTSSVSNIATTAYSSFITAFIPILIVLAIFIVLKRLLRMISNLG